MSRHHTAVELEFLKQSFERNAPFEHGGHTLDLLRARGGDASNESQESFEARYKRELAAVNADLDAQRAQMADAFVDMEVQRLRRNRNLSGTSSPRNREDAARATAACAAAETVRGKRSSRGRVEVAQKKTQHRLSRVSEAVASRDKKTDWLREGAKRRQESTMRSQFENPVGDFSDSDNGKYAVRNAHLMRFADARAFGINIAR